MGFKKSTTFSPTAPLEQNSAADLGQLAERLNDADPALRRWAARDLVPLPTSSTLLVARLRVEPDITVREALLSALARIGDVEAVQGLVACLRSEDANLRNEAIETIKALPNEIAPMMSRLLRDPDSDVRIFALNILESLRHPCVEAWLIEVIDRDPVINVCGCAVDLLAEVGTPAARSALQRLQVRFSEDPYIQFSVGLALTRIDRA